MADSPTAAEASSIAFNSAWSTTILDHEDADVATQPSLAVLERACRHAAQELLEEAPASSSEPFARADEEAVAALRAQPPASGGVSIGYFLMGHRKHAHSTISRLLYALWNPAHLFLMHLDARANSSIATDLTERFRARTNVHVMTHRRAIGWGAFSQVDLLLRAIATLLAAAHPSLDFVINLSDADVALRTDAEVVSFLARFRERSFVATKFPSADAMRYAAHSRMRESSWLECGGHGFLILNETAEGFFRGEGRRCCYARSGPLLYAPLPILRPPSPTAIYHGSQWLVLARSHAQWLVHDPSASALARHLRLTYMADETFVQSALMASPHRGALINHNLRHLDWPHATGDPSGYYHSVGQRNWAGPMILTEDRFETAASSPALFARKVDLEDLRGVAFMRHWDAWMAAKRHLERARWRAEGQARGAEVPGAENPPSEAETVAARQVLEAWPPQPLIAEPLLRDDPTLASIRPPPTSAELAGLDAEQMTARSSQRLGIHFGHEDLMSQQLPPPPAPPPTPPPPPPFGVVGFGFGAEAWSEEWVGGDLLVEAQAASYKVAEVTFVDGSRCSCGPRCGGAAMEIQCCERWEVRC